MNSLISKTFAVFLCLVPLTVTIKSAIADNSLAQSSAPISKISTWQKFLVNIVDIIPSIPLEIRYSTAYNFIGRPVDFFDPISHTLSPKVSPTQ
ncbi:MAG: hypothetical protein VKL42_00465 [Snowella sp.]|nr:hypothetical protein [Snowella sp.]